MKGFVRWWNGIPIAGRLVVGLLFGGVVFAGVGLGFDWTSGAIVVGILLGAVLLFLLVRWLVTAIERRRGQGLSAKLWSRMSTGEGGGLDATSEELSMRQEMQRRWKDVHDTLRERQYDYYSFPWYLILGAAQSGKTTTIQQSNQEFPIGAEPVIDYGGTKGCNWFFTNKAILIDTAGRYVEHLGEDDADWDTMLKRDQEEWETFLRLLKEERGRSPINGVIVTVKLEDLLEQDPRRQKKISESLRKALIHIEEQLEIRVPIYVLVTMMDLLVGFVDFFKNLPGLSDRSLFGWSRPGAYDKAFDPGEFGPAFASLANRVDSLLLEFMEAQAGRGDLGADTAKLDRMLAFPDEFRSLGEPLAALLESLFKKSAYNEQHFFRGVYFTSGRQEGRPVMNACLSLVGDGTAALQEEDVSLSSGGGNKAYFIADLYEEKVFHEGGLVRMTKRASSTQRLKKRAYLGVAAVLAVAAGLWVMQEVTRFQSLAVFEPSALTALGERGFVRADIEVGSPVLVERKGLAGVAQHLTELRSEAFREATILGRAELDETASALLSAYRKLYAEKVFATLLDVFLDEQRATPVTDWRRCLDLTDVLLMLRALGRGDDLELDAFRTGLLPVMKGLHLSVVEDGAPRVDYQRIGELAAALGEGDASRPLAEVRAQARARMDDISGLLRTRVTTFWVGWLDAFGDPLSPDASIEPDVAQVEPVWRWLRMRSLDEAVAAQVVELTHVLEAVPGASVDLSRFGRECVEPWRAAFDALDRLRGRLDAHVNATGALRLSAAQAGDSLETLFAPLQALYDEGGSSQSERDLADAIRGARGEWQAARDGLVRWSSKVHKGEGVVTVTSRADLAEGSAAEAAARVSDALGLGTSEWTFANRLDNAVWRRMGDIDELVSGDPSSDPILDPGSAEFWTLREESAFAKWLDGPVSGDRAPSDGGGSLAVKKLIEVASGKSTLDDLRRHRRAAFFEALRLKIADEPARAAFLQRIDITRLGGRFLGGDFTSDLSEHPANADVAYNLGKACMTLRASAEMLTKDLLDKLYLQYLDSVFVPFWDHGLVDVARAGKRVPTPPPVDHEGFRAWHAALVAPAGVFDGVVDLARFAGAQQDRFDELFATGLLMNAQERLKPARELWTRYRLEPGKATATSVERLRGVASGLAKAMTSLAQQPSDATPYERLHPAQRGTPVYDGLMEPARLQSEGSVADPIVRVLVETAASVRSGLGQLASRLFAENWAALGPAQNGPGRELGGRFPFERDPTWGGDNTTPVSRDEAERFFSDAVFRQLVEVVHAHLDPLGPSSASLYQIAFPASPGDHRAVFRRCVELRDLCGFDMARSSEHEVALELFDSLGFVEGSADEQWSTRWTFDLTQGTPKDTVQLVLPFVYSPKIGDLAARWVPTKKSTVQFMDSRPGVATGDRWRYTPAFKTGDHWADVLVFTYSNKRAAPSEVRNDNGAVAKDGVRWITLHFQRGGRDATRVLGVRMKGMPDELPDLDSVWPR